MLFCNLSKTVVKTMTHVFQLKYKFLAFSLPWFSWAYPDMLSVCKVLFDMLPYRKFRDLVNLRCSSFTVTKRWT